MQDFDGIAADVLARTIAAYRGRGLSDEQLLAAGSNGVAHALARFEPERGYKFETWCTFWVKQAIARALDDGPRDSASPPLFASNFEDDLAAHRKRIGSTQSRHAAALADLVEGDVSAFGIVFYDLFSERYDAQIEPWLAASLAREAEAANRLVGDDEQVDYADFCVHALELPDEGRAAWRLYVAFEDSDAIAHFAFDGWKLASLAWSD